VLSPRFKIAAFVSLMGAAVLSAQQAPGLPSPGAIAIIMERDPVRFKVTGSSFLKMLSTPNFPAIFGVYVVQPSAGGLAATVPPMTGEYAMEQDALVFHPKYPLQPGVSYRAVFKLSRETAIETFNIPKPVIEPTTVVQQVYPTAAEIPENQLKFYVHFSASMSKGQSSQRIHLLDEAGKDVQQPFLSFDDELWDREYKRITILFDPGRVKTGVRPNRDMGLAMQPGKRYTLVIDQDWSDATGTPLKESFRRTYTVGPRDTVPLDPKTWRVLAPTAGSQLSVTLDFPESVDAALLLRVIEVQDATGAPVDGKVTISREETRWAFVPNEPWKAGNYVISVISTLEDLAGNKVGRLFEVDTFEEVKADVARIHTLPFKVQ
jgi:hypothetical protein